MNPLVLLAVGSLTVLGGILVLRLHAFVALILGALLVTALTPDTMAVGERVAAGFGKSCASIGLLIAMASIIGAALLDSGGADRIVRTTLGWLGESRGPLAFLVAGFVLGIPVFSDTVLLLLIPLAKTLAVRRPRNYLLFVLSIFAGATMTHSLVPPTPGPTAVAAALGVDIGAMMLGGLVVGLLASSTGFMYALWINRRAPVPLREDAAALAVLEQQAAKSDDQLPPFWLALAPIVLPVALVTARAVAEAGWGEAELAARAPWLVELGDKNVAVALGAAAALAMLAWQGRGAKSRLAASMQSALSSAGVVILITAAGGAFGESLRQAGVGPAIEQLAKEYRIAVLPLAFVVTVLIRTAQGSATVAMITAAGILAGFADNPSALGFHPVYLALAIGCGSKLFAWMNDSGFWLISRVGGLTEAETLKASSVMLAIMGCAGMLFVMLLAAVFPMAPG